MPSHGANLAGMALPRSLVTALLAYVTRLRFPVLFLLSAVVFVADLLIPDVIPVADEVLLGLLTAGLAAFRKEKQEARAEPPMKDVTPS